MIGVYLYPAHNGGPRSPAERRNLFQSPGLPPQLRSPNTYCRPCNCRWFQAHLICTVCTDELGRVFARLDAPIDHRGLERPRPSGKHRHSLAQGHWKHDRGFLTSQLSAMVWISTAQSYRHCGKCRGRNNPTPERDKRSKAGSSALLHSMFSYTSIEVDAANCRSVRGGEILSCMDHR